MIVVIHGRASSENANHVQTQQEAALPATSLSGVLENLLMDVFLLDIVASSVGSSYVMLT